MPQRLERLPASAPPSEITHHLRREGAVIVENLIAPDVIARINDEVDEHVAASDPNMEHLNPGIQFFFGKETRHVAGMPGKSRSFATEVMVHPTLMSVCDEILLPACARYQLNLGHLIDKGPGGKRQLFHRDELVWVHVPRPHPELQVASMIALEDFTEEIGATNIVPGSHEWPLEREPEEHEVAIAEMPAGSAAIYLGSTIHAGGENRTTDRWRRGLHTSWICGWLRTEENNYLACPPDVARTLPRQAQEVLGYAVHDAIQAGGGYAGALDLQDPCDLIEQGKLGQSRPESA
jgi:ectoine hydroxylase-related dioxygenase (phytanoyl-CoA dioxygenase family)